MFSFSEYIKEAALLEAAQISDLIAKVNRLGFEDITKLTNRTINVAVDDASSSGRASMLNPKSPSYAFEGIKGRFVYQGDVPGITSSAGALLTDDGFLIQLKPKGGSTKGDAGKLNELNIMQAINFTAKKVGPFTLVFKAFGYPTVKYQNVTGAEDTSRDVVAGSKSDFIISTSDNRRIPISLKQANAEFWGSEKSRFKQPIQKLVWKLVNTKSKPGKPQVRLVPHKTNPNAVAIIPEVAVKLGYEDVKFTVFGNDILQDKGAIITQTFHGDHVDWDKNTETLTFSCKKVITSMKDLKDDDWPWLVVVNNVSKAGILKDFEPVQRMGVDIRAANKKRVHFDTMYVIDGDFDLEKV